eukprot:2544334-Rhodomonas_salina.1
MLLVCRSKQRARQCRAHAPARRGAFNAFESSTQGPGSPCMRNGRFEVREQRCCVVGMNKLGGLDDHAVRSCGCVRFCGCVFCVCVCLCV